MTGVLLVHGAWHGPWCWDAFADRLLGRGHQVRAVQLRGHDGRPGRIWHRIHHYVEDVERAAAEFDQPPVPVGHSMGGLVTQKYLERNPAPGAVLMASIPSGGVLRAVGRLAARHPVALAKVNLLLRLRPLISISALVRPRRVEAPVLVLGAERDGFFTVDEVRRTARAYRTEAQLFPGMGHDMMLDQGWEVVADRIDAWLRHAGSDSQAP